MRTRDLSTIEVVLSEGMRNALQHSGLSGAALGRALTSMLGRSIDRAHVQQMLAGKRTVAADILIATARITRYPLGRIVNPNGRAK